MSRKADFYLLAEAYTKVNEGVGVVGTNAAYSDDTVTPNEGPGGVLEIQPDGQHPEPPKQDENAVSQKSKFIMIDLYNGSVEYIPAGEERDAVEGLMKAKNSELPAWKGEEYIVVKVG